MSFYELLLALHVVAAIIWLGAGFVLSMLLFGAERAGDPAKESSYHADIAWLTPRLFIPSSLAVLLAGILLVIDGSWTLDVLWIAIGLGGWLASFLIGILYFRPEAETLKSLAEEQGPGSPEIEWRTRRVTAVSRFELSILFLVVMDMSIKPTGDDWGVLAVGAAIVVLGATYALSAVRSAAGRSAASAAG